MDKVQKFFKLHGGALVTSSVYMVSMVGLLYLGIHSHAKQARVDDGTPPGTHQTSASTPTLKPPKLQPSTGDDNYIAPDSSFSFVTPSPSPKPAPKPAPRTPSPASVKPPVEPTPQPTPNPPVTGAGEGVPTPIPPPTPPVVVPPPEPTPEPTPTPPPPLPTPIPPPNPTPGRGDGTDPQTFIQQPTLIDLLTGN